MTPLMRIDLINPCSGKFLAILSRRSAFQLDQQMPLKYPRYYLRRIRLVGVSIVKDHIPVCS